MDLIRINDVVEGFDLSSRTLRYYEQVGILWSIRPDNKAQRYYDEEAMERLKQIIVLRKLQIPIKDIVMIFKDSSIVSLIKTFVDKLEVLDTEIEALSEMRQLVDDFLQKMLESGIKKISAITLLYEETKKRLAPAEGKEPVTFKSLTEISRKALSLKDVRVIRLPAKRILTSCTKSGEKVILEGDNMQNLFADYGLLPTPGLRNCFYFREPSDEWIMAIEIPEGFINTSPYIDGTFEGGMFAITSSFMEDMDETRLLLREWINQNENFELDMNENGTLSRGEMIEEILPWDIARLLKQYQQDIFIPIRIIARGDSINE